MTDGMESDNVYFDQLETPIGDLIMAADSCGLQYVTFHDRWQSISSDHWIYDPGRMEKYTLQMKEYLAGERKRFSLPLAPRGTPFQLQVWHTLTTIPFGRTISYGELAEMIGRPGAARAVGNANGRNPIVIIQPCHRVVAAQSGIGGFSAGIYRKRFLLGLERGIHSLF